MPPKPSRPAKAAPLDGELAPGRVRVRMYRQGIGDCFLVSIGRLAGGPFRLMVDCGVLLGTPNKDGLMQDVVRDLARTTGGKVDVLAVTHEHYDHVSGFALADAEFKGGTPGNPSGLKAGETWFAWTEKPDDPLAQSIRKARTDRIEKLHGMVEAMGAAGLDPGLAGSIGEVLDFFGAAGSRGSATADGMARAGRLGASVCHLGPDEPPRTLPGLPGVRFYVLGPPRNETLLKRTFASDAVFHLDSAGCSGEAALMGAAGLDAARGPGGDDWSPFEATYCHALEAPVDGNPPMGGVQAFLNERYWGSADDPQHPDQEWRRIGSDWLAAVSEFAMQLDAATNNTSLVLAIEAVATGKVLLLAADAQVGSWQSWAGLSWTVNGRVVTGPDLLGRTVLYKVGHHGSQNATLNKEGLQLMPDGLVAFLPVDHAMATVKHWDNMPLPKLLAVLNEKSGGKVVQMDQPFPKALGGASAEAHFTARDPGAPGLGGPLFYEWEGDFA